MARQRVSPYEPPNRPVKQVTEEASNQSQPYDEIFPRSAQQIRRRQAAQIPSRPPNPSESSNVHFRAKMLIAARGHQPISGVLYNHLSRNRRWSETHEKGEDDQYRLDNAAYKNGAKQVFCLPPQGQTKFLSVQTATRPGSLNGAKKSINFCVNGKVFLSAHGVTRNVRRTSDDGPAGASLATGVMQRPMQHQCARIETSERKSAVDRVGANVPGVRLCHLSHSWTALAYGIMRVTVEVIGA